MANGEGEGQTQAGGPGETWEADRALMKDPTRQAGCRSRRRQESTSLQDWSPLSSLSRSGPHPWHGDAGTESLQWVREEKWIPGVTCQGQQGRGPESGRGQ